MTDPRPTLQFRPEYDDRPTQMIASPRPPVVRRRLAISTLAAGVLASVAVAAFALVSSGKDPTPTAPTVAAVQPSHRPTPPSLVRIPTTDQPYTSPAPSKAAVQVQVRVTHPKTAATTPAPAHTTPAPSASVAAPTTPPPVVGDPSSSPPVSDSPDA